MRNWLFLGSCFFVTMLVINGLSFFAFVFIAFDGLALGVPRAFLYLFKIILMPFMFVRDSLHFPYDDLIAFFLASLIEAAILVFLVFLLAPLVNWKRNLPPNAPPTDAPLP